MEAFITLKTCLRPRVLTNIRSLVVNQSRYLRGRPSSEAGNEFGSYESKSENEPNYEFEDIDNDFSAVQRPKEQTYVGRHRDVFERAKRDFGDRYDRPNRQWSNDRPNRQWNNDRSAGFERYEKPERYYKNDRFDDNYDSRKNKMQYNDRRDQFRDNRYRNDEYFDGRNRNRNQFDGRRERSDQHFDRRDRYNHNRQQREYKNYRYKAHLNEFTDNAIDGNEDNAIYKSDNQLFDDQSSPRFSRSTENQFRRTKQNKRFDENEDNIENYINEETEVSEEGIQHKRDRPKIPLPYNVTLENRFEVLNQIVTPLHLKPYNTQLKIKFQENYNILRKFGAKLKIVNHNLIRDASGMPCPLEQVKPSPITERYRNKDEFSIWPGVDGYSKTLGFFIGQPSLHENVVCVEPDNIIVSRESHLSLAKKFQNYLKDVTQYDSCQNYGDGGHWRRFHIRSNASGHHMITAIMHPQELSQQELDEEMKRYKEFFEGDERISSMYFQASRHTRLSNEKEPFVHLFGEKTITETLFDKKFEISVDSFFQVNNSAAEVLYRNVISELNPNRNTTILDICCGTGTLATILAPDVCRVIGIDSSQSAINDAQRNAKLNDVKNVNFLCGTVEQVLPKLMDDLYSDEILVVANPTRAGLHSSVVNMLREINSIKKVVYVSCKPDGYALKNFVHLCMPSGRQNGHLGPAFLPVNAIPVDLFPQTTHCELIITFERF